MPLAQQVGEKSLEDKHLRVGRGVPVSEFPVVILLCLCVYGMLMFMKFCFFPFCFGEKKRKFKLQNYLNDKIKTVKFSWTCPGTTEVGNDWKIHGEEEEGKEIYSVSIKSWRGLKTISVKITIHIIY